MSSRDSHAGEARDAAPRIRRLPDGLVDQIAAGEVVERPASVVKELVENALDADATRVRVETRDGGIAGIVVVDDGYGMSPEEARLALERHATSKLRSAGDLARIATYGFRGEALPAIASVSRLRLRTRARGSDEGFEIRVESGRIVEARAAAGPPGTRLEVADLFGQVPARRKFLKSPQTEWSHVAGWMAGAALARPGVHFELQRDDRAPTVWPATSAALDRIAAVLGEATASGLVAGERSEGACEARVFASRPDRHHSTSEGLHLFVNGRPVRDRLLRHAVLEVYRDVLPRGRFPAAVLFLSLPAGAVDVNVHPAKWEVRFADPRAIHALVTASLREAIGARRWLAGATPSVPAPASGRSPGQVSEPAPSDWIFARGEGGAAALGDRHAAVSATFADPAAPFAGPAARPIRFAALRLLGQALATYLVVEGPEGLLLVDQHAAHERILYERLRAAWLGGSVPRQLLLAPAVLELPGAERDALLGAPDALEALGFDVEPFGEGAVAVRALPALLAGADPLPLLRGVAEELRLAAELEVAPEPSSRAVGLLDRALATLACHAARRKGEALARAEQEALLAGLDTIPFAPTCPHGRPVAVPFDLGEIERRFGRR